MTLSDFEEYLDQAGVPDPAAEERWQEKWKEQQQGAWRLACAPMPAFRPRSFSTTATLDERFRLTWHRQRNDFTDQSQSPYDMALADFGVKAGLADQVIVDMLIEHRRIHRRRPKLREDYYRGTLAKAHQHMENTTCSVNQICFSTAAAGWPPPVKVGRRTKRCARLLICERLSALSRQWHHDPAHPEGGGQRPDVPLGA
jgi:hypothetical protein